MKVCLILKLKKPWIITGSDYYTTTFSDATIDPGGSVLVEFIFAPADQAAEAMASASFASNAGTQTIELKAGYMDQSGM